MSLRDDQLATLKAAGKDFDYYNIANLDGIDHLPYSLKVLVENLVRNIDGANITDEHVKTLLDWDPNAEPSHEIQFTPSRVIMQDFTGVPCIVDLATMRDAVKDLGGDPEVINPQVQSDMVIDHSVQIDKYGIADAVQQNMDIEYQRNGERYQFLRWGQQAFKNFRVVPPGTGHYPPGQHRILGQGGHEQGRGQRQHARLPRLLRGHRLAHHHRKRSGRARLGRRRHRGRGRHARPADLHARAARGRLQAHRAPSRRALPPPMWS